MNIPNLSNPRADFEFSDSLYQAQRWDSINAGANRAAVGSHLFPDLSQPLDTGYWASLLIQKGADVIAYDLQPPQTDRPQKWGHTRQYTQILPGTAETLAGHGNRTLLLCWPPMGPMAAECLYHWRGETLIYIGEGSGGMNADDEFFAILGRDFNLQCEMEIPRWYSIHDWIGFYRRRARVSR